MFRIKPLRAIAAMTLLLLGSPAFAAMSIGTPSLTCPSTPVGGESTCNTAWLGANPAVILADPAYTSDSPNFSAVAECTSGTKLAEQFACVITLFYHPQTEGSHTGQITFHATNGQMAKITLSGQASSSGGGHLVLSSSVSDCGHTTVGTPTNCPAITAQAVGGPVTLGLVQYTNPGVFLFGSGGRTCVKDLTLAEGATCIISNISHKATSAGVFTMPVVFRSNTGAGAHATFVADASSNTWQASEWGACTGGSGAWQTGPWAPELGCGTVERHRTVSCAVDSGSATQTRVVQCKNAAGVVLADSSCYYLSRPASTQSCSPSSEVCGEAPGDSQTAELTNDCPSEEDGEQGGTDDGEAQTPPTPVKKELCTPDAANQKYCLWMPL